MGDREFGSNGMRMQLCGRDVTLPRGPALLSLRSRAPLLPIFLIREGLWAFRLYCEPLIWPAEHDRGESPLRELTERYAAVLERYLRRFPEQWLMFRPMELHTRTDSLRADVPVEMATA